MSKAIFGDSFDIHGGGADLMFPHHENEKAQSCCLTGENSFARFWLHNEMLQIDGRKMAKSLGNFFTVRDLLDQGIPGEVIRFVYLGTHHSKTIDWTEARAKAAEATLRRWHELCENVQEPDTRTTVLPRFVDALCNNLNTPAAIAILHELAKNNRLAELKASCSLIGLLERPLRCAIPGTLPTGIGSGKVRAGDGNMDFARRLINDLVEQRGVARARRDFATADQIRSGLIEAGVIIEDRPGETAWRFGPEFNVERLHMPGKSR